ncbi:MAG: PAS domain-containing protein [Rhodovibrionaceae bacterium]
MIFKPRHWHELPEEAPEELHWFYGYWQSKRPEGGGNPPRCAIDPADFPRLLNTTFIVERTAEGRHKMRLAGTFYHQLYGQEITGAYIEDLAPLNSAGQTLQHAHDECARCNGPVYTEASTAWISQITLNYRRLLLPLAGGTGEVAFMIGTAVFYDTKGNRLEAAPWGPA